MSHKSKQEIIKFGLVGGLATLVHFSSLVFFVEFFSVKPETSNVIAFFIAVSISYIGQSYWVFLSKKHSPKKMIKFLTSSLLGLFLNYFIMNITVNFLNLHYSIGFFISTLTIPFLTFVMNKNFIFKSNS